jgi:Flp pilus assembly protein TadD
MEKLVFWQNWKLSEKIILTIFLVLLVLAAGFFVFAWYSGVDEAFRWEKQTEFRAFPLEVERFQKGFFEWSAEVPIYVQQAHYQANPRVVIDVFSPLYLFFIGLAMVGYLSAITYLPKLYFAIGTILVAFFLSFANFDGLTYFQTLLTLNDSRSLFIAALLLYLPLAFVFNSFYTKAPFSLRLTVFSLISAGFYFYIKTQAAVVIFPENFIASQGIVIPLVISVIFILLNGHEIPRGLLYITTLAGRTSNTSMMHFFITSGLFALNSFYVLLKSVRFIEWEIYHLPPKLSLLLIVFLALWGVKHRASQYEKVLPFGLPVAIITLAGGVITLATFSFSMLNANDPMTEGLEDVVIFSQVGFSIIFIVYIVANYGTILEGNYNIYKILWQPRQLDWSFAALMAYIIVAILLYRADMAAYRQIQAGIQNLMGDTFAKEAEYYQTLHTAEDLDKAREAYGMAEYYYNRSAGLNASNHKMHIGLATLALKMGQFKTAYNYYNRSLGKNPTPQAYAMAAQLASERLNDPAEGFNKIYYAKAVFPENPYIWTNLSWFYLKDGQMVIGADTLYQYLNNARRYAFSNPAAEINFYAFQAIKNDKNVEKADSLRAIWLRADNIEAHNNELLWLLGKVPTENLPALKTEFLQDTVYNFNQALYLYHYTLAKRDTTLLNYYAKIQDKMGDYPELMLAQALLFYQQNRTKEALENLRYLLQYHPSVQYWHLLAVWYLENENYRAAADIWKQTTLAGNFEHSFYRAIALSHSKEEADRAEARSLWRAWDTLPQHPYQPTAREMLRLLSPEIAVDIDQIQDDEALHRFLYFRMETLDEATFTKALEKVSDLNVLVVASAERIRYWVEKGEVQKAQALRDRITGLGTGTALSEKAKSQLLEADLALLYALKRYDQMLPLAQSWKPERAQRTRKNYYLALYYSQKNDSTQADRYWQLAHRGNPMDLNTYQQAVAYYNKIGKTQKGYDFVSEGLRFMPDNIPMKKLYILQALENRLETFARSTFEDLSSKVSENYLTDFKKQYDSLLEVIQKEEERFFAGEEMPISGEQPAEE